jgi:methionyl aminopeptidase
VVHGIPGRDVLREGDIVGLDFGVRYQGMLTDGAVTVPVGQVTAEAQRLLDATIEARAAGVAAARAGNRVGDVSAAIERVLRREKLGVIQELVGHGVGYDLWEEPNIPNYGKAHSGPRLKPGMTLAIEPMATLGDRHIVMEPDGWTVRTKDGSLATQFEHTVLITPEGPPEILTQV